MNVLEELQTLKESYKQAVQTKGQEVLDFILKDLLDTTPEIEGLYWTQYTPYFNDGEPCVFSIHEVCIILDKNLDIISGESDYYSDDLPPSLSHCGIYDSSSLRTWTNVEGHWTSSFTSSKQEEIYNKLHDVAKTINELEDICREVFGDGVKVIATRDGYEAIYYDHD